MISQNKRAELIEQAKLKLCEAFRAFEQRPGSQTVSTSDLGAVVRSLGHNITEAQVKQLQEVRRARWQQRCSPPVRCLPLGHCSS
jgi:Ca2+-binding EF-hand superfamily protein